MLVILLIVYLALFLVQDAGNVCSLFLSTFFTVTDGDYVGASVAVDVVFCLVIMYI